MKKNKWILSVVPSVILGIFGVGMLISTTSCSKNSNPPGPTPPEGSIPFTKEYFDWDENGNSLTITGLKSDLDLDAYNTLWIPPVFLDGDTQYNVTSIANNAFRDAFNNGDAYHTITNLDLTIAINLNTIGQYAFEDCSGLTGMLTIPSSVDNIGYMGFSGCVGFNIINASTWTAIPTIGNDAFSGFNSLGGAVIVPPNPGLGITIGTFKGLPSTWIIPLV